MGNGIRYIRCWECLYFFPYSINGKVWYDRMTSGQLIPAISDEVRIRNKRYLQTWELLKRKNQPTKENKKERKSICPDKLHKLNWLPVGLKECGRSRKLLNRNHLDKVPTKTAKSWKMKEPWNKSNWYFKLFEVSFKLNIIKIRKLQFSTLYDQIQKQKDWKIAVIKLRDEVDSWQRSMQFCGSRYYDCSRSSS